MQHSKIWVATLRKKHINANLSIIFSHSPTIKMLYYIGLSLKRGLRQILILIAINRRIIRYEVRRDSETGVSFDNL